MLLRGTLTLRGTGPFLLTRSIKAHGGHTPCFLQRRKKKRLDDARHPTTIAKSNKVFLLAKSSVRSHANEKWKWDGMDLKLVVGNVKNSTGGEPSKRISWENPQLLLSLKNSAASYELKFERVFPSGGSGVVMEDGTPVFPWLRLVIMTFAPLLFTRRTTAVPGRSLRACPLRNALTPRHRVGGITSHGC
ncbi:trans-sialidase [Trypanosoma cruzi]|nr:trans-sialidase [Trypanosoma cruzi]